MINDNERLEFLKKEYKRLKDEELSLWLQRQAIKQEFKELFWWKRFIYFCHTGKEWSDYDK